MVNRRQLILVVSLLGLAAAPSGVANADPLFKKFTPLLVDLPGWQGAAPEGLSMDMGQGAMTTASRKYTKGSVHLDASLVVGIAARGALAPLATSMQVETSEGHMIVATVDGFKALKSFQTKDSSGAIMIGLTDQAMFAVNYRGLSEDEALALAKNFDWNAMKALATKTE